MFYKGFKLKILITGGCGYKGSVLVPRLLGLGYEVIVHDTQWFGSYLKPHKNLELFKTDITDTEKINFDQVNAFIHLANVANDPAVELNPTSSWEINVLASQQLVDKAIRQNVEHIIFASSGSVYGVKEEDEVTEDLSLVPISAYNKTKMVSERVLYSYKDYLKVHCIRPATVSEVFHFPATRSRSIKKKTAAATIAIEINQKLIPTVSVVCKLLITLFPFSRIYYLQGSQN